MAKRKKKAWNNTNPLYRYLHSRKSKSPRKKAKRVSGVKHMARRKHAKKTHSFGGGKAKNMIMHGLYQPKGIVGGVLLGLGAASLSRKLPQVLPMQDLIAAAVVGGIPAVAAVWGVNTLLGAGIPAGATGGSSQVYI
jgi:hypothetical protein